MKRGPALAIVATLMLNGAAVGAQPTVPAPERIAGEFVQRLAPGTSIKLTLSDGKKMSGTLIAAEEDAVMVRPKARIPEGIRRIPVAEIADADIVRPSPVGRTIAIGAAVGAGAALGFLFVLAYVFGGD